MPFWQHRCWSCQRFRRADPNDATGACSFTVPRAPFWMGGRELCVVGCDDGEDCEAYLHNPKPFERDDLKAMNYLLDADVGDKIGMRNYRPGAEVERFVAEVLHITDRTVVVRMFNRDFRLRLKPAAKRELRAGRVVGSEHWGVDPDAPIIRRKQRTERPEKAVAMLHKVRAGDALPLIGYPPFDGVRKLVKVTKTSGQFVTVRMNSKRTAKMHRTGPLAGIIDNEVFCLDTTGDNP